MDMLKELAMFVGFGVMGGSALMLLGFYLYHGWQIAKKLNTKGGRE